MASTGHLTASSTWSADRLGAVRIPRRAHVVARGTPAEGDTWGKPRDPIENAKDFLHSSTKNLRSRVTQSADELGTKAAEAAREVDRRYSVRVKFRHAQTDFQRMLPHWKRRFRQFSSSRAGKATLWMLLLWSIVSGTLFRVFQIVFLLWWVLPLVMIPLIRRGAAKAQQNMYGASGPGGARGSDGTQRPNRMRGFGNPFTQQRRPRQSQQDGQVIDVEWTTIDADKHRGQRRQ